MLRHLEIGVPTSPASVRERELEVGRLVLRAAATGDSFLLRRAQQAVSSLDAGPARRALRRVVDGLAGGDDAAAQGGLLAYGGVLERHAVYDVAADVYRQVMESRPGDARVTLHAARAVRRAGRRSEALELYREAGQQSGEDGHLLLLVRIGEALVSETPVDALSDVVRDARRTGDMDALAIAREERSRFRAAAGHSGRAIRDLAAAAGRYTDRIDRVRAAHSMGELLSARGDLAGAREALLAALDLVHDAQRGHTVQRLRTVARAMGDELELRRSRGQAAKGGLVTLAPMPRKLNTGTTMRIPPTAPALRRWRSALPVCSRVGTNS